MNNTQGSNPLATLLDLAQRARHVAQDVELDFLAVNASHALAPYRQAALWSDARGICALSGVVQIEANAPYAQALARVCAWRAQAGPAAPGALSALALPPELGAEWTAWLPAYGLWLPLPLAQGDSASAGGLLLARDLPWMDSEIGLLAEWADMLRHAYAARYKPQRWTVAAWRRRRAQEQAARLPFYRRRAWQVGGAVALLLCIPVRLSVLAPGELVPANPAVVRAPLEGVIARFHVKPNQLVKRGDALFDFDEAQLQSRDAVAAQALSTAEAEYRQAAQLALSDAKSKGMLATLQGRIEERRAETGYLRGQVERARVLAPGDGVALFDDPSEWLGRPVNTGERIMRIAAPTDVEVEAWLPVGDAIDLPPGAPVTLYLAANPLDPIAARVRYVAYEAQARPDGSYAYRVRARLAGPSSERAGLKGTAKLSGPWTPMIYWMLRRPLAMIRQALGL
jgi:multidrug resistance efflux pump